MADSADSVLATNQPEITAAMNNIESSTDMLKNFMDDVQSGKGLAGTVLQNEQLATNVQAIAEQPVRRHEQSEPARTVAFSLAAQEPPPTNAPAPAPHNPIDNHESTLGHPHLVSRPVHHGRLRHQPGAPGIRRHGRMPACRHGHRLRLRLAADRHGRNAQGLFAARLFRHHFRPAARHRSSRC